MAEAAGSFNYADAALKENANDLIYFMIRRMRI